MPAFKFESNLQVILLIIVIALISLYFYLDLKKVKLVNEELEKKNEMIIKEIDNIHLRLHKFFNGMPPGVVPIAKMPKSQGIPKVKDNKENNENIEVEKQDNKKETKEEKEEISNKVEKMIDDTIKSEISENDFNNLKKKPSNNIFGEIEDIINDSNNNIIQEENINNSDVVIPDLIPVSYESDKITEVKDSDDDDEEDDEDDEVEDVSEEDNSDDENISDNLDEDLLEKYMKMSYKNLKEKCIEMNLKHSGNKTILAKRIVENL